MIAARSQQPSHLLYNAHETLEKFRERQCRAYHAGKLAWREGLINGQALQLYNELVRCVGANKFAWVKEDTLADLLGRSASTIKRWMSQLVSAELIHRGRRFGSASLTYIVAYSHSSEMEEQPHPTPEPAMDASSQQGRPPEGNNEPPSEATAVVLSPALTDLYSTAQECSALPEAPFVGSINEPSIGSFSSRQTFKSQHVKTGGEGGKETPQTTVERFEENEATSRLQAEGVTDPGVLHELQARPIGEVECAIRYVARCRGKDDPRRPGLIVHLIRRGFGTRRRSYFERPRREDRGDHKRSANPLRALPVNDPRRYLSQGFCCHGVFGNCPWCDPSASTVGASDHPDRPFYSDGAREPVNSEVEELWQAVQAHMHMIVPRNEYETWIQTTTLLALEDGLAIVGTPNIFVREEVQHQYKAQLEATMSQVYNGPINIQVVIGTS